MNFSPITNRWGYPMRTLFTAAAVLALLSGSALAESGDGWQGVTTPQEKEALKSENAKNDYERHYTKAFNEVWKSPLGREYKRQHVEILRGKAEVTPGFLKLEKAFDAAVKNKADSYAANSGKTYQTWRGESSDNQKSGATSAADRTGGNANMADKAR